MEPLVALLSIFALFALLASVIAHMDGLAFLAPKSTRRISPSAERFCTERCRQDGRCPLTGSVERAPECPLWKYIESDAPTVIYGSPFEPLNP